GSKPHRAGGQAFGHSLLGVGGPAVRRERPGRRPRGHAATRFRLSSGQPDRQEDNGVPGTGEEARRIQGRRLALSTRLAPAGFGFPPKTPNAGTLKGVEPSGPP